MLSSPLNSHQFQGWVCTRDPWQNMVRLLLSSSLHGGSISPPLEPLLIHCSVVHYPLFFSSLFSFLHFLLYSPFWFPSEAITQSCFLPHLITWATIKQQINSKYCWHTSSLGERDLRLLKVPIHPGKPCWNKGNCLKINIRNTNISNLMDTYDFQLLNCWDNLVLLTMKDLADTVQHLGGGHPCRNARSLYFLIHALWHQTLS